MRADKDSINNGSNDKIIEEYQQLSREANEAFEQYSKLSFRYSMVRLASIVLGGVGLYFAIKMGALTVVLLFIIIIGVFAYAVKMQVRYDRLKSESEVRGKLLKNEVECILRKGNIYYNGEKYLDQNHDYAADLDVFGPFSIFEFINRCRTYFGHEYLFNWLAVLSNTDEINSRKEAVRELEGKRAWRLHFATMLYNVEFGHEYNLAERFKALLSMNLSWADRTLLKYYINVLLVFWPLIILGYFLNLSWINNALYAIIGVNFLIYLQYGKRVGHVQAILTRAGAMISHYSAALYDIFKEDWKSAYVLKETSFFDKSDDSANPVKMLSKLAKIIEHLDFRLNLLVGTILNLLFLWDLRVMLRLVKWRSDYNDNVESLFRLIGFFEGLSSLATFADNQSQYNYPEVNEGYFTLKAHGICHPLIISDNFVPNDFEINDQRIQVITGSNMSGKSTFLRTIGLNMVLAYAGTKVAASGFKVGHARLISYMRIKDALEENVSTFKAELNRVEKILSMMKSDLPCFILIDEMLRGTNSKDKLKGSMAITKKIIAYDTYAMIATHDIQLAEMARQYPNNIDNYYFDIDFVEGELSFDYKIRKGICENFNASFLLKQLGVE